MRSVAPSPDLSLATYDYEPAWISNFSLPAQDADGWSVFTPSADSRLIYVDATSGNDGTATTYTTATLPGGTWDDPAGVSAYQTPAAGLAQMRSGYPDYLLLKRGESFDVATRLETTAGRSVAERKYIGAYGTGNNPVLNSTNGNQIIAPRYAGANYIAIVGLDFTDTTRDPDHPDFVGFGNVNTDPVGVVLYNDTTTSTTVGGSIIEGCRFYYLNQGISIGSDNKSIPAYNEVIVRRNTIRDTYKSPSGGHPMGMWATHAEILVEENIFIGCGFYDDPSLWGTYGHLKPTVYSHSTYCSGIENSIFRNNISCNPCSIHHKFTANPPITAGHRQSWQEVATALTGVAETAIVVNYPIKSNVPATGDLDVYCDGAWQYTATELTGAAVTSVTITNPIPANTPTTGQLRIGRYWQQTVNYTSWSGSTFTIDSTDFSTITVSATEPVQIMSLVQRVSYTSWSGSTFTIPATDFSTINASVGQSVSHTKNLVWSDNIAIYGNVWVDGEVCVSYGGNNDRDNLYPRFDNVNIQGNIAANIGYSENTTVAGTQTTSIGWGLDNIDADNSIVSENLFLPIANANVTSTYATSLDGYSGNVSTFNNHNVGMGSFDLGHSGTEYGNADDIDLSNYVDGSANLESYMQSIGLTATLDGVADALQSTSMENWPANLQADAFKRYFNKKYALTNGYAVLTDVANTSVQEGDSVTFTYDIVANSRVTGQWNDASDDSPFVGETGPTFAIASTDIATHNGLQLYRICVDDDGTEYRSATVTLTVTPVYLADAITTINSTVSQEYSVAYSAPTTGSDETFSVYVKHIDWQFAGIQMHVSGTWGRAVFDLVNKTVTETEYYFNSHSIVDIGSGWSRITVSLNTRTSADFKIFFCGSGASSNKNFASNGNLSIGLYNAILNDGTVIDETPANNKIADNNDFSAWTPAAVTVATNSVPDPQV